MSNQYWVMVAVNAQGRPRDTRVVNYEPDRDPILDYGLPCRVYGPFDTEADADYEVQLIWDEDDEAVEGVR
jgi:hypothetical protein